MFHLVVGLFVVRCGFRTTSLLLFILLHVRLTLLRVHAGLGHVLLTLLLVLPRLVGVLHRQALVHLDLFLVLLGLCLVIVSPHPRFTALPTVPSILVLLRRREVAFSTFGVIVLQSSSQ